MRFIGNKTRLIHEIEDFIKNNKIEGEIFCDMFSGSSSVGDFFKKDYKIIANDFLKFSSDIAKAKLLNPKEPDFRVFKKKYKKSPFEYFNNSKYEYEKSFFVTSNYSPKSGRQYLSEENAIRIDGIRIDIEEFYKNKVLNEKEYFFLLGSLLESTMAFSNTTGTYEAFLKKWDNRSVKNFVLSPIKINEYRAINKKNKIYNEDANSLIRKISGDILYIDPPYTVTEYSSAYHVLETISRYDFPEVSGVTGRRVNNNKKSMYTRKNQAIIAFEDLIRQSNFKHIIISYSNESLIVLGDLKKMLASYSKDFKVIERKISYRKYKNIRESKKGKELFEVLLYIKKDNDVIKSPLNYSGSKDKLMPQIKKYFPGHIDIFVDVMGGSFNVGSNVVAKKIIYNEYNNYVFDIIKMLLNEKKNKIIRYTKNNIKDFGLDNGKKEEYNIFREKYNKNKKTEDLFILSMFSFQNQLRFNSSFGFNTPVGNCAFNDTLENRIRNFNPKTKKVDLMNFSFEEIDYNLYSKNSLFYFDPPYFITSATYNDGKRGFDGWNSEMETKLLKYLTDLDSKGYKFMLSNIIYHKGKTNHILKEWMKTHDFNRFKLSSGVRKEILITNYDIISGKR